MADNLPTGHRSSRARCGWCKERLDEGPAPLRRYVHSSGRRDHEVLPYIPEAPRG